LTLLNAIKVRIHFLHSWAAGQKEMKESMDRAGKIRKIVRASAGPSHLFLKAKSAGRDDMVMMHQ